CDEVERDVDPARFRDHVLDVTLYRALVQGVELGHLGRPASGLDVLRHGVERRARTSDQKDARPFASKGPSDASAYPSACAVDDCRLALEKSRHVRLQLLSAPLMGALTKGVEARGRFSTCDRTVGASAPEVAPAVVVDDFDATLPE